MPHRAASFKATACCSSLCCITARTMVPHVVPHLVVLHSGILVWGLWHAGDAEHGPLGWQDSLATLRLQLAEQAVQGVRGRA